MNGLPQNPTGCFVNGSDEEFFTFAPGKNLYHLLVRTKGHIMISCLLFADDENHIKEIFLALCEHKERCWNKYIEHAKRNKYRINTEEIHLHSINKFRLAMAALQLWPKQDDKVLVEICLAPRDQFYKVAWAGNDGL